MPQDRTPLGLARGIARTAAAVLDPALTLDAVLQMVTDEARELIGAHQAVVSLTTGQNWAQAINSVSLSKKHALYLTYGERPDDAGMYGLVCSENRAMRLTQAELERHPAWYNGKEHIRHPPMRGWLAVPIPAPGGGRIGVLQLSDKYAGEFTEEDEELAVQLAGLAAVAIHNTQVRDALRQSEERLRVALDAGLAQVRYSALNADIGLALTSSATIHEMLQRCAEAVVTHMDAALARVWTLELSSSVLELQASAGMSTHLDGPDSRVPVGRLEVGLIAQERRAHLTNHVVGEPGVGDQAWAARAGMVAFAGFPLIVGGQLVGVLAMFARHPLTPQDFDALDVAARMVGVGVERKQAEAACDRALAEVAAERRRLETSNAELDQFAYIASHDLKAPMRGIGNIAQWIEEDLQASLREETREMLALMRSRMHRMEALVDGILQYSRAGRVRGRPETVDVGDLVGDAIELLAPPASTTLVVKPGMPTMITERLALEQVFMNLIGNAIKYTRRAGARVEVAVRDSGEFYEFAVSDNGPGIAPEYHERIWAIFQTLEPRDQIEGTGIGLSLVKKTVEARGGRVWLESAAGCGAAFRFQWPKFMPRED